MNATPDAINSVRVLQPRKGWLALLLSLLAVGVGHFYAGRGRRGVVLLGIALSYVPLVFGLALLPASPLIFYALIALAVTGVGVAIFALVDAMRIAQAAERPFRARPCNNAVLYVGVILASSIWSVMGFVVVRGHAFQAYKLASGSMEPTMHHGDRFLVNKWRGDDVRRGDIVVFRAPERPEVTYIKRVVGLPGETIRVDKHGQVWIDESPLERSPAGTTKEGARFEERVRNRSWAVIGQRSTLVGPVEIPRRHVFVLGDNRPDSEDSRSFGPIPLGDITGVLEHVLSWSEGLRLWSPAGP